MLKSSISRSVSACRIGLLLRQLMHEHIKNCNRLLDGSLVTHASLGTDIGLYGGLLGWQVDDERIPS